MAVLHNLVSKADALKKVSQETFSRRTVSFYRYVKIEDPQRMRDALYVQWNELGVLGRVYVAREGINAQISVPEPNWDLFVEKLHTFREFSDVPFKMAVEDDVSFWKLKIKVRKQIVADGLSEGDYDVSQVGTHLSPEEFHNALGQEDVVVVDMRNHYESRVGRFENALCPNSDTFREELPMVKEMLKGKEDKKVLLYCTGGIRCEKASSYLKHYGFKDVNQLYGGIINYTHEIKQKGLQPRFLGKNFVFDERMHEKITDDVLTNCDLCAEKCDEYTNCKNTICNLLFVQCQPCIEKMKNCCSEECLEIAQLPIDEQKKLRANTPHSFTRYKKQIRPVACGRK
jgi:UPF0176 protein